MSIRPPVRAALLCLVLSALVVPVRAHEGHALLPDFTSLVEQNYEAVVNISAARRTSPASNPLEGIPGLENTPLDELFKRYQEEQQAPEGPGAPQPFDPGATGSGFIISSDGYVLTNNHVIDGADEIVVRLHDRRQLSATLVGTDARSDVALLKLDATNLPVVRIGDSNALDVGEWVLAIGSPFGFDFSVTAGIVSATGRALPRESYVPFIQTDVAINPGNSGGPLFNLDGEVIGINSQIYSRTGSFMGLSFAIPIEMAVDVADQLRNGGKVSRGWLGVIIQEVDQELAKSFNLDKAQGALISRILPDSPAEKSPLRVSDVITHFNGQPVERSSSLPPLVGRVRANSDAKVRVMREGEPVELIVNIGELPSENELRASASPQPVPSRTVNLLAIEVAPLDDDTRARLEIDTGGVLVSEVSADGPADKAGIEVGDVLLMVDNKPVDSAEDFAEVVGELDERESVAVLVQRPQGPVFLALQLAE